MRLEDEAAFTLATMKAVITQLKTDQKATQEKLVAAERRAEEKARKFEILAREIDLGLIIFDAAGLYIFLQPPGTQTAGHGHVVAAPLRGDFPRNSRLIRP